MEFRPGMRLADIGVQDGSSLSLVVLPSRRVATSSLDGTAMIWDLDSGERLWILWGAGTGGTEEETAIGELAFSPDGQTLLTGSDNGVVKLWSVEEGQCLFTLCQPSEHPYRSIYEAAFSPNGQQVLTCSDEGPAKVFSAETGQCLFRLSDHDGPIHVGVFSSDSQQIATASGDGNVRLWSAQTGKSLCQLMLGRAIELLSFSPNGQELLCDSRYAGGVVSVEIFSVATGACLHMLQGHTWTINSVTFSPDGQRVLSSSVDGTAKLWTLETGQCITFGGHGAVSGAIFSPDGQQVLTHYETGPSRLWSITSGECLCSLEGHLEGHRYLGTECEVYDACFSLDGQRIVTASGDSTAKIWTTSGECLHTLSGHSGDILRTVCSGF